MSREAALLVNNWILLFSAVFVLFATMFPTLSEAVTGARLTVGPPFYTTWMLPIGLILLTLTGVGPLLAWRKSTPSNLRYQFTWPVVLAAATIALPAQADFKSDWKALIAAAQKEGKVVIAAVPGTGLRKRLPGIFKKKFGVDVEIIVTPSRQTAQRAIREAAAGAGTTPSAVGPVAAALWLPDWFWGGLCGLFSAVVLVTGLRPYLPGLPRRSS